MTLLALLLLSGLAATAAVPRSIPSSIALPPAAFTGASILSAVPSLPAALEILSAPVLAPAALFPTQNALIGTSGVSEGLAALRAASYPAHPDVAELVARISAAHPELPISVENVFMVRDPEVLRRLEIPEDAAGAARILFDGRAEAPVVILSALRPVGIDNFVEFGVHEAVHLMDDGILRVPHDEELKHFFAEGWTQRRAIAIANEVFAAMGRPATPGKAYRKEIALVDAFIARHGTAPLDELVRTGSDEGMRRALGARWDMAARLVSGDGGPKAPRARRLDALLALVNENAASR